MAKPRSVVHSLLQSLTGYGNRIYFNPPETIKMQYPCIVYHRQNLAKRNADNKAYIRYDEYSVTHIYARESEHSISEVLVESDGFEYDRNFYADNLNHDVFTLRIY